MDTALIVALVGVGGALLGSAISIVGNCILEVIKSKKEKKNYISKALFEKQFLIYQELSEKFIRLIDDSNDICTTLEFAHDNATYTNGYQKFLEGADRFSQAHIDASSAFQIYCPYISSDIDEKYRELINQNQFFCKQIKDILNLTSISKINDICKLDNEIIVLLRKQQILIVECWKNTIEEIRKYFHSLEVK